MVSPSFKALSLACAIALSSVLGCGSQGGRTGVISANDEGTSGNYLLVRWFPVDTADGYVVYLEDINGTVVYSEEAVPTGCTHTAKEGYSSGLCSYEVKLPNPGSEVRATVSAINRQGEGERSLRVAAIHP